MKLKDVVIEGFWLGLKTVDECVAHFCYRRPPIFKYKEEDLEVKKVLKELSDYKEGKLVLNFNELKREARKLDTEDSNYIKYNRIKGPWEFDT